MNQALLWPRSALMSKACDMGTRWSIAATPYRAAVVLNLILRPVAVEPRIQGFWDGSCGYSSIAPITCGFRNRNRASSAVIFGCLDVFCDHKVSKRSLVR